jgi:hypothetical protein
MKKLIAVFSILCLISWFTACGGSGNTSTTPTTPPTTASHVIKGQAAIGAFLNVGSQVQIRPIPVSGIPCDIIKTTVTDSLGSYSVNVSTVRQAGTEVTSNITTVSGYVIRAMSVAGWIYSFADNTDESTISNINPYTDLMVKKYYEGVNDITVTFQTGYKSDGITPIDTPNPGQVEQVISTMSNMLARVFNMPSIEDFMTGAWAEGAGLDGLLNNATTGPHLNWFLNQGFTNLFASPDALLDGAAIQSELGDPIIVDIWTTHGDSGTVTLGTLIDMQGHVSAPVIMTKEADSDAGNNHFHAQTDGVFDVAEMNIMIYISDYNGGAGFQMVIQTP